MIETSRLQLLPCTLHHFEALFQGEEVLADLLDITVPDDWTEYPEMVLLAYDKLRNDPSMLGWFFYLVIHKEDKQLIGTGGFKGKPGESGVVEIGYEIAPAYREQGYATEMVKALIDFSFSHTYIDKVRAHTLEEYNAAVKVLQKAGMHFAGAFTSEDEDELWRWEISRSDYKP